MSTTLTLLQLRNMVRERSDMVNNQFITDTELNSYINQSYFELYDLLVQKYGDDYYVQTPYVFTTTGTDEYYPLPADFYKLLGLDLCLNNSPDARVTIKPFMFSERNRYAVPNFQTFYGVTNLRYRLFGNQLWLTPIPTGNQIMRILYVPRMTTLSVDADTVDGISGWDEYIVIDAAIKCLAKEESDVSVFMAQKQAMIARIEAAAENRDAANPMTVSDSRQTDYMYPYGSGVGYGGN